MRAFLHRIRAMWLFSRCHPYVDAFKPDFWTEEDAKQLQSYLTSPSGNKWRLWMLRTVQESAYRATLERNQQWASYLCGYAAGGRALMAENDTLLQQLSASETASRKDETPEERAEREWLEQYAP